jgi:GNAT superfamily N-acetyltransferase
MSLPALTGQLSFRPFSPDLDGQLVIAFARDVYLCTFGNRCAFERKFGPDGQGYVPWLKRRRKEAMLAYEGDTLVGMVVLGSYKADPTIGYVSCYYLVEQARGRTLGDELGTFACQVLRDKGFAHARLSVSVLNTRAVRFYRRRGGGMPDLVPGVSQISTTLRSNSDEVQIHRKFPISVCGRRLRGKGFLVF